jgi:hypothetical protein
MVGAVKAMVSQLPFDGVGLGLTRESLARESLVHPS